MHRMLAETDITAFLHQSCNQQRCIDKILGLHTRVVTMHRCIAILGPAIGVSYRDPSIAIRIAIPQVAHHHTSALVLRYKWQYTV